MTLFNGIRRFLANDKGASAIEFGFVAPILVAVVLAILDGGLLIYRTYEMRSAISSGSQYLLRGGANEAAAKAVVLAAWGAEADTPTVDVASSCRCGDAVAICSALCPDETAPKRYFNIDAKAHFAGFVLDRNISAGETIRVR
jgi:Flp pilus assembly protein TadG